MKVKILTASVASYGDYDFPRIAQMSYDEALDFFRTKDSCGACSVNETDIDTTKAGEYAIHADGLTGNDPTDTMYTWIKVY